MPVMTHSPRTYEIGNTPLLTAVGEKKLSQVVEAGLDAVKQLEVSGIPLSAAERRRLRRVVRDGRDAEKRFVQANLRLVEHHLQNVTIPHNVERADLFQEGAASLHTAVQKFDWRKGFKFSTYASWWIQQAISHELDKNMNILSCISQVVAKARQAERVRREFTAYFGRQATDAEVAETMGVSIERLHQVQAWSRTPASLEQPIFGTYDDALLLGDTIADEFAGEMFEMVEDNDRRQIVQKMLKALPEDERKALMREMSDEKPPRGKGESAKKHRADARRGMSRLRHPSTPMAATAAGYLPY